MGTPETSLENGFKGRNDFGTGTSIDILVEEGYGMTTFINAL